MEQNTINCINLKTNKMRNLKEDLEKFILAMLFMCATLLITILILNNY